MNKYSSKYYVLLLLVLMFAAPGIAAYLFYQHPSWLGSTKVNKGTLLNPSVVINELEGKNKWQIIYWSPDQCANHCLTQLETLARIRLALGRKLYQVDQRLILADNLSPLSEKETAALKQLDFQVTILPSSVTHDHAALFSEPKIFLANPNNFLILSYSSLNSPDDVYKDLKLLLNTTEKNG